jgi:hypothetical protein
LFCSFSPYGLIVVGLFGLAALVCSFFFVGWCETVKFDSIEAIDAPSLHYGVWLQRETETVAVTDGDGTEIYVRDVCRSVPSSVEIDSKWKAARALSVATPILGFLLLIPVLCVTCMGEWVEKMWKLIALAFMVVLALLQGLSFLIFKSNACQGVPLAEQLLGENRPFLAAFVFATYESECEWDSGSTANAVAVAMWFLTGCSMLFFPPP